MRWCVGWDGVGEWGGIRKFVREERAGVVGEGARAPVLPCMLRATRACLECFAKVDEIFFGKFRTPTSILLAVHNHCNESQNSALD